MNFEPDFYEKTHLLAMKSCLDAIQQEKPLILKGGSALMFGYGLERFSEDLDFDIAASYQGKSTIKLENILKKALPLDFKLQELSLKKDTPSLTRYILFYKFQNFSRRLKIEVSYRSPVLERDIFIKNGNKFLAISKIAEFKIKTVLSNEPEVRTRARDLFDAAFIVQNYFSKLSYDLKLGLKNLDLNSLISRYQLAFEDDEIMQKHKINIEELALGLVINSEE